jgi:hypothetical protein
LAEKNYFSLPAAARELGVSTDVLRRQYRTGLIPAIKTPGGQPRFTAEAIEGIKQNGWPRAALTDNEFERIQSPAPHLPREAVDEGEISDPFEHPPINHEELDSRAMQGAQARGCRESEPRQHQHDVFHFHRKWIDYTCRLLPFWLTPEQVAEVSRQIENEIKGRTPIDEPLMTSLCGELVRLALLPLSRQRELTQVRNAALNRVLAKIPFDATENEKVRVQVLARNGIQQAGEQVDGETLFALAWHAAAPVVVAIELRRQRERLRPWALQKLPRQANEREQRDARAAVNKVIEQMNGEQDEAEVRNKLEEALEPVLTAIPKRIEEEHRRRQIPGLLSSARLHVGTYLNALYHEEELEYEAICDWEWRRELEGVVDAELRNKLRGDETDAKLTELVEEIVDAQLEGSDDDE